MVLAGPALAPNPPSSSQSLSGSGLAFSRIQPPAGPPAPAPAAVDIESHAKNDPQFAAERVQARRASLGLEGTGTAAFLDRTEFVSLGCFCGVSAALKSVGLRGAANPFDWVRSPVDGVIHCFETDFEDFLTFTVAKTESHSKEFKTARWGGSFWHHDIEQPGVREDFTRRIERMLGLGSIPAATPRAFVRAVNSTSELPATLRLHEALKRAFPETTVYLLVLIDLQEAKGPVRLEGGSSNLLFWKVNKGDKFWSMETITEVYSEGVAFAARLWAGRADPAAVATVPSLAHFGGSCLEFDGGSTANELYLPRRFQGQRITLGRPARLTSGSAQVPAAEALGEEQRATAYAAVAVTATAATLATQTVVAVDVLRQSACGAPLCSGPDCSREQGAPPRPWRL